MEEIMDKKEKIKNILLALAACFGSILLYKLTSLLLEGKIANSYLHDFVVQAFFAVYAVAAVFLIKRTDVFHAEKNCLKSGWSSAFLLFAFILFYSAFGALTLLNITATVPEVILVILYIILIGFTEEILFRGVLQRAFHRYFTETSLKTVLSAIVISGFLFGIAHLGNFLRIGIQAALPQALVNIFSGIYFGAVYFRTGKHPWYTVILHALYDWSTFLMSGRLSGNNTVAALSQAKNVGLSSILIFAVLYLGATAIILRPSKLNPLLEKKESGQKN